MPLLILNRSPKSTVLLWLLVIVVVACGQDLQKSAQVAAADEGEVSGKSALSNELSGGEVINSVDDTSAVTDPMGEASPNLEQDMSESAASEKTGLAGLWNMVAPTLGGRQFWGDLRFFQGWRIQRNVFTGHHRLIDPADKRHAWGTQEVCNAALERIIVEQKLPPQSGKAVILIHGIIRSSKSFEALRKALTEDGYLVVPFDYPSTRVTIAESAEYLHQTIQSLQGVEELSCVCHSMGGLLVRSYLSVHDEPRWHRMVMLGVPNNGAEMANMFKDNVAFRLLFGPAGQQLIKDPAGYISSLPTPKFAFAIVAGARGDEAGYNPLIPGDDDGTVTLASARLPGAADFMTQPVMHSFLMFDKNVVAATRRFLATGALRESGECEPVE